MSLRFHLLAEPVKAISPSSRYISWRPQVGHITFNVLVESVSCVQRFSGMQIWWFCWASWIFSGDDLSNLSVVTNGGEGNFTIRRSFCGMVQRRNRSIQSLWIRWYGWKHICRVKKYGPVENHLQWARRVIENNQECIANDYHGDLILLEIRIYHGRSEPLQAAFSSYYFMLSFF